MVDLTSTPSSADDTTLAVWVTPQLEPFSCECVHTMKTFYRIKKSCNWWARDMDWINQDWMKVTGWPVEFFADETASAGRLLSTGTTQVYRRQQWNHWLQRNKLSTERPACSLWFALVSIWIASSQTKCFQAWYAVVSARGGSAGTWLVDTQPTWLLWLAQMPPHIVEQWQRMRPEIPLELDWFDRVLQFG
ncbi:hypothetical protein PC116_g16940 [Phytophthora cactorum]|nr:hypothetical protein PC116_g16940 [Phytophthora cactorum]